MELSIYNQYASIDDKIIVYNTRFENAICFEESDIEKVKQYLKEEPSEEIIDMGLVSDTDEVQDVKLDYYNMKYSKEILYVMIVMTYKCNCSCSYCFENLDSNLCKEEHDDPDFVAEYLIDTLKRNHYKEINISFFGGEPTLKINDIIRIKRRLTSEDINHKCLVITNGTLLNHDNFIKLYNEGINTFQITLDGPKFIHDKRRPTKSGQSCWDLINSNILGMLEYDVTISIRINIDSENVSYLEKICKALPDNFVNSRNIIYISPVVGCKIKDFTFTLKNRTENLKHAWEIIKDKNLPIQIIPPTYAPCPYSSFESAFYIDLKGNVYTCGGFIGKKDKIERTFDRRNINFWDRINYIAEDSCFKCSFFPVCMGGCKFEKEQLGKACQYMYLKEMYDEYYTKYQ